MKHKHRITAVVLSLPFMLLVVSMLIQALGALMLFSGIKLPRIAFLLTATILGEVLSVIALMGLTGIPLKKWFRELGFKTPTLKKSLYMVLIGVLSFIGLQLVSVLSKWFSGESLGSSETSNELGTLTGNGFILFFFIFVPFIGPFAEELLYRGFMSGQLYRGLMSGKYPAFINAIEHSDRTLEPEDYVIKGVFNRDVYIGSEVAFPASEAGTSPIKAFRTYSELPVSSKDKGLYSITEVSSQDYRVAKRRERIAFITSLLIPAILFGISHTDGSGISTVLWTGFVGGLMGYVYLKNNNIWYSFILHSSYNLTTALAITLL